jgi:hypothetical protein
MIGREATTGNANLLYPTAFLEGHAARVLRFFP